MDISEKYFTKERNFVTRCIGGETIIVPVRTNVADLDSIYTLNEVGTLIWELMDGQKNVKQIVESIWNTYEVTPEEAEKDTLVFLNSLREAGLIANQKGLSDED